MFSILKFIWLMIIISNTREIQSQAIPTFCETRHFQAVFNLGSELMFRYKNFYWIYKDNKITEPPLTFLENQTILCSVYISKVPECTDFSEKCTNYNKALYLAATRILNKPKQFEYSIMQKIYPDGKAGKTITDSEVPWAPYIDISGNKIWPQEWSVDRFNERPAVYWPEKYRILFISDSGQQEYSKILFNNITDQLWYRYRHQKLHTDIHFVGMFHYKQVVYAVGDYRHRNNSYDSVLYKLIVTDDYKYIFEQNKIGIKQFFGCGGESEITITDVSTNATTKVDDTSKQSKQTSGAKVAIIILASIITAAFISAIIIVIVYFLVKKLKPSSSTYIRSDDSVNKDESVVTVTSSYEK